MRLRLRAQATVYGRSDPVVDVKVVEETVSWKLAEFKDAQSGFANLTGGDHQVSDVVQCYIKDAPFVPKGDKE